MHNSGRWGWSGDPHLVNKGTGEETWRREVKAAGKAMVSNVPS